MVVAHNSLNSITWLSVAASVWICFIFCGQIGLVASDTTTYQVNHASLQARHSDMMATQALKHQNFGLDMCSLRALRSVWTFLRTGHYQVVSSAAVSAASKKKLADSRPRDRRAGKCESSQCKRDHSRGLSLLGGASDKCSDTDELLCSAESGLIDV